MPEGKAYRGTGISRTFFDDVVLSIFFQGFLKVFDGIHFIKDLPFFVDKVLVPKEVGPVFAVLYGTGRKAEFTDGNDVVF